MTPLFDVVQVGAKPPAGRYQGEWFGYYVRFGNGVDAWEARTKDGIRGRASVWVVVDDAGRANIEPKE